jgi:DNA-binding transcriptional ArsR family regulator
VSSDKAARSRSRPARKRLTSAQVRIATATLEVLVDPTRLRIVHALLAGPRSVTALAKAAHVSASAISHQLGRLREQRIVDYDRDGTTLNYRLTDEHIAQFCREALYHADHVVTGRGHDRPAGIDRRAR